MRLHPREMPVQEASALFKMRWLELDQSPAKTFAAINLAFNAIDRFWIEANLNEMKVKDATATWDGFPLDKLPEELRDFTRSVGRELVWVVTKNDLTYGEIMKIISDERLSSAKYHIRSERHPSDPDRPGLV